jgi:Cellulase (glycosyl hydrolase family 5)
MGFAFMNADTAPRFSVSLSGIVSQAVAGRYRTLILSATLPVVGLMLLPATSAAQIAVFSERGIPAVNGTVASAEELRSALPGTQVVSTADLSRVLSDQSTRLLVISGTAFPEQAWPAIFSYLQRGGNLLTLGGRPFAQAAYQENGQWHLRPERNVFMRKLFINDYTATPGSRGLQFESNSELPEVNVPRFDWNRAYSMTVKLSQEDLYTRQGSTGSLDTVFRTLAWGTSNAHHLAAPVVELDHLQNSFVGGRWDMVNADLPQGFFSSSAGRNLVTTLAHRALEGAQDFTVRPHWALFLPGEPLSFQLEWNRFTGEPKPMRIELTVTPEQGQPITKAFDLQPRQFPFTTELDLPAATGKGFHTVNARLMQGAAVRAQYKSGFWIRDSAYLNSGPRITVNQDFFEVNGRTMPVIGTTYMASDVQRNFFMAPNPWVWDQDFADMHRNGVNMIRTGIWSGWDQVMKLNGVMQEDAMRAFEAFLMTARKHEMPVQFNLFAFLPEVFGGQNPYLDPEAVRREKAFVAAMAERFKNAPWLMWDIINEPSFDKPTHAWATRANEDQYELMRWNEWLNRHYGSHEAIAAAWNTLPSPSNTPILAPAEQDFNAGSLSSGGKPLMVHDFYKFAQESFTDWTMQMSDTIRGTGSKQLITVGQDEGGGMDRLNPSSWGSVVDFTTSHPYWQNDALLWDNLYPKYPNKPMLVQEVGIQNDFNLDGTWRRDAVSQADLVERKLVLAAALSSGSIEWLWNVNSYMTQDQEVTIGMVRTDGTDKPEVARFHNLANFLDQHRDRFRSPEKPQIAIITSQAFQYSALNSLAVAAQQRAVRILHNEAGLSGYLVAENLISTLGNPKLAILPSPEALAEPTWQELLRYVNNGGTLLVTGSMERDPHWVTTHRLRDLGIDAERIDLTFQQADINTGQQTLRMFFADQSAPIPPLDALRFRDGATWKEIRHGKGRLLIAAYPVELAEGMQAAGALYRLAAQRAGVEAAYDARSRTPGVLIRPTVFADSVLYLFMSESGRDEPLDVTDKLTGARMNFVLPAQRTALLLLSKQGAVLGRYGF